MKTLKEQLEQAVSEYTGHADHREAFRAGWEAAVKELTRWHDPKDELPEPYHPVLVRYGEHRSIAVMWLEITEDNRRIWTINDTNIMVLDRDVIGWRPIHEQPEDGEKTE